MTRTPKQICEDVHAAIVGVKQERDRKSISLSLELITKYAQKHGVSINHLKRVLNVDSLLEKSIPNSENKKRKKKYNVDQYR